MERLAATLSLAVGLARHGAGNSRASTAARLPPLQFGIAGSSSRCYRSCMTTMTLKLPGTLLRVVEDEARRRGVAKSALVRECVETALRRQRAKRRATCLDLVSDLVGSQPGPSDASVNRRHLNDAVLADYRRGRKNSR